MKLMIGAAAAVAAVGLLSPSMSAQWPSYPTAGVPRLPNGQPNLSAPAPRTADGKPDLSGVWENRGPFGPLENLPPPADGTPPEPNFWNVGARFKGGLPYQPWAAELRKKRMAEDSKDNPDAHCLPMGNMQLHMHPQPNKILQTPGVIVIMYEGNAGLRQIFTDGRPLPNNDPQPSWYGYSVGKWDGDTLVVETTNFRDGGWLDVNGSALTDAAKTIERFRRVNYGTLQIDVTVDDPKAYTRPWTVRIPQYLMLDTELIEFVCAENERSTPHFSR